MRNLSVYVNIGAKYLPSLNSAVSGVERRFGLMNRRLRVMAAETKATWRSIGKSLGPAGTLAAAAGLSMGFKGVIGEGAEYQHQIVLMRNMGRTTSEVAKSIAAAKATMFGVPTSTMSDSLKILNETTLAYGGLGHAIENLKFNSKMGALMKGVMGEGYDEAGGFNELVRALELRSGKMSSKDYQRQADGLFKAMIVSGGKVNPSEFLGFMQQAGVAARGWNENFLTRVAPSLIQEMGGERAGTALTALFNQMQGRVGVGGKSITQEWQRLGLVLANGTPSNLAKNGWTPGSLKGNALAMADPLEWIDKVLFPAFRAKGINTNDKNAMLLEAQKMFGRETGKRVASTLFDPKQRERIKLDMGLYGKAAGVDKAYSNALYNDPRMAGMAAANSLKNLETALGKSVWQNPAVVKGVVHLANGINMLAGVFDRHPRLAQGITGLLGLGAATATLSVFNIGLRFIGRELGFLFSPLTKLGGLLWRTLGPMAFRGLLKGGTLIRAGIMRLGPMILEGFASLAPVGGEGLVSAFALISNPVGWTVLAGIALAAAGAFVWHFRKQIGTGLSKAWGAIKGAFLAVPWANIGMAIADALTFGLASKLPAVGGALKSWWQSIAPTALGGKGPAPGKPPVAGHRRFGGPVVAGRRYIVGEAGEEEFVPGRSGVIVPHSELVRRRAERSAASAAPITINIYGAHDPHAVAREVDRVLKRHAAGQAALLSD